MLFRYLATASEYHWIISGSMLPGEANCGSSSNSGPGVLVEPGEVILLTSGNKVVSPSETASVPESPEPKESAPCRNRTCNPVIKSHLLCQLS